MKTVVIETFGELTDAVEIALDKRRAPLIVNGVPTGIVASPSMVATESARLAAVQNRSLRFCRTPGPRGPHPRGTVRHHGSDLTAYSLMNGVPTGIRTPVATVKGS